MEYLFCFGKAFILYVTMIFKELSTSIITQGYIFWPFPPPGGGEISLAGQNIYLCNNEKLAILI